MAVHNFVGDGFAVLHGLAYTMVVALVREVINGLEMALDGKLIATND